MTIDIASIRTVLGYIALALAIIAAAKFAGVKVPIPGEFWQIGILAIALK